MKSLTQYIQENYQIEEKLSFGKVIDKWITQNILRIDVKEQHETATYIKNKIDELSDGKIGVSIMKVKEIEEKMNNCINKDEELVRPAPSKTTTLEKAFKERIFWNNIKLFDDTPFICFYSKENKDKFFVWDNSPWYFGRKDKKGNREIRNYPIIDKKYKDDVETVTWFFYNVMFPQILDPEGWKEKQKQEKEEIKKNAKERIEAIQKELEELKKQIED